MTLGLGPRWVPLMAGAKNGHLQTISTLLTRSQAADRPLPAELDQFGKAVVLYMAASIGIGGIYTASVVCLTCEILVWF